MIISISAENASDKIQYPFIIIKKFQKMGIDGTYLNIIKAIYDKPTANIILNGENYWHSGVNSVNLQGTRLIYRNLLHFYLLTINNKISKREIKEATPFTNAAKRIKYLGISLPKEAKDLYSENYKILVKEN